VLLRVRSSGRQTDQDTGGRRRQGSAAGAALTGVLLVGEVLGPGSTPPRKGCSLVRHPPRIGQRSAEEDLHLSVDAAELVVGPPDEGVVDGRVDPEKNLAALTHVYSEPAFTIGVVG
jgi:hypothetical protein